MMEERKIPDSGEVRTEVRVSDLYGYSVRLGANLMLRGHLVAGLRRVLNPVNYWRTVEMPWVFRALSPSAGDRLLDIGSPKLLSLYLAERLGCIVWASDILADVASESRRWQVARSLVGLSASRYIVTAQDGRSLACRGGSFDKAYAISVFEHIPGEGDSMAMREMARVLRPGGLAAVTVPYSPNYREEWVPRDVYERKRAGRELVFYQRRYDHRTTHDRLISPSGLALVRCDFYTGIDLWDDFLMHVPLVARAFLAPLQPLPARFLIRPVPEDQVSQNRYNLACLLLRKAP
jgi:SAM-dependent methyltransferase